MIEQTLQAGVLYFALVFASGFVLGAIRTLWIVPRVGTRTAELIETPIMFAVVVFAARWVARRFLSSPVVATRIVFGLIALGLLLIAECGVVLWLRGQTIRKYIAERDPVAGTVYLVMLAVYALMPVLVAGK